MIGQLKTKLSTFKRQRGKLYSQLDVYKKDKEDNKEALSKDFEELQYFFPEIDVAKLSEVEEFHREISKILTYQINESEKRPGILLICLICK